MVTIYVSSIETFSGKSALCVGLGRRFLREGFSVGYMKPVSTTARRLGGRAVDEDVEFIKRVLELSEPEDVLCPAPLDYQAVEAILRGEAKEDFRGQVERCYQKVAQGKDVVILEGGANMRQGCIIGLSTPFLSELFKAHDLVVLREGEGLVDDALTAQARLGESLDGVVINVVPKRKMEFVENLVKPYLEKRGIRVLGILPQERLLMSISVAELAERLGGEMLCCREMGGELVEDLMVGAMGVDSALSYFRRKPNKAVITGGDRPDIQLAALETSTKCLILTGNLRPSPIIVGRAEELGVPIILCKQDTLTAVQIIEEFFGRIRPDHKKKIQRFDEILEERFDFRRLYSLLGLKA